MIWTVLTQHSFLLLLTATTLVSPFLFMDKALSPPPSDYFPGRGAGDPRFPGSGREDPRGRLAETAADDVDDDDDVNDNDDDDAAGGYPYYSRQSTLMMAANGPRIGLRSSLIGSVDTCHVDPVKMSIRPPRRYAGLCAPTTEISYGCRGGCHSYSRVDARNASNVLRSCSCCRPTGFGFRLVKMKCDGFALRTTVKFALGCHCRPCMASVESADIQRLRDLLRGTSLANIG